MRILISHRPFAVIDAHILISHPPFLVTRAHIHAISPSYASNTYSITIVKAVIVTCTSTQ